MRLVRAVLATGWLLLIASLFWDPITPSLTRPDNLASPFHLQGKSVAVQGRVLAETPYAMANRFFWTMLIPLLPLFLMVFGHEAWRRVCPLSFISQLPRYLNWQHKKPVLVRRTGQVERQLALVARDGWLGRNVLYVQFTLLFLALCSRLLFFNSDRLALAVFFIGVILAALTVGYFWGGKTWCGFVCPISVVQKIYTGPGGLLESQAHLSRQPVSQSMCRAPSPKGDVSTCVGCTPNCPDIDLERSYWQGIDDPARRHVYYGFFGLIFGFYYFYYWYSGNWDYYFSGAWTHEQDQLQQLFRAGLYIKNQVINIPKILAVPMVLGIYVLGAIGLGKLLEVAYRRIRLIINRPLPEADFINHCLSFSAYVSINSFYCFGGRPNLDLLPPAALRLLDIVIVSLTTLWFLRSIQRSPTKYRREGLASNLLEQLKNLHFDASKHLDGRTLEELKPDEIYVLAKTLPSFSRDQKLQAYENILLDTIRTGRADAAGSLEFMRELRGQMGVSDSEHHQLLEQLGLDTSGNVDPDAKVSYESWIRTENYRKILESLVAPLLEQGIPLQTIVAMPDIQLAIENSRAIYQISPVEHDAAVAQIAGVGGMQFERARSQLKTLRYLASLKFGLIGQGFVDSQWRPLTQLLSKIVRRRVQSICTKLFSVLLTLGNSSEANWIANKLALLIGSDIDDMLALPIGAGTAATWVETLDENVVYHLRGGALEVLVSTPADNLETYTYRDVVADGVSLTDNLRQFTADSDPLVSALSLTALAYADPAAAREMAARIRQEGSASHWLLLEVLAGLIDGRLPASPASASQSIRVTIVTPGFGQRTASFEKPYLSVGRASDNDIALANHALLPYHFAIIRETNAVTLQRLDALATVFVNAEAWRGKQINVDNGVRVSFSPPSEAGSMLILEWDAAETAYTVEASETMTKLLRLSQSAMFQDLNPASLAEIARTAEVRVYASGAYMCRQGDSSTDAFLLQTGSAEVLAEKDGRSALLRTFSDGAIIGELAVITREPRSASVRVTSETARVVVINGAYLHELLEQDVHLTMSMLGVVATSLLDLNKRLRSIGRWETANESR
ncbi:MAG: cyclic nucleotide-binding domain-containing protein [Pseudomonadota bacterium]|nr:cyclic nucleotide-binding domain-containing protein [Pseudomonadota bacterium]